MKAFKNIGFLIVILFIGCTPKNTDEVIIDYLDYDVYVKMSPYADAVGPPIYHLHFKIKNVSNETKVFISQSSSFDEGFSELILNDTVQKIKIPLYTGDRHIMKPNKEYDIDATIDIKDFKDYFKLSNTFFDEKLDFSNDKKLLEKLFVNMMNSSIIKYKQDTSDVFQYRIFDEEVQKLKNKNWILVNKAR